jgi:hypothetical protein
VGRLRKPLGIPGQDGVLDQVGLMIDSRHTRPFYHAVAALVKLQRRLLEVPQIPGERGG